MSVTEFYGQWADLYDRIATAPGVGRWRKAAARRVADPGDTVVEMGCGTGANLPYLRERVGDGGRVVGVDVTPEILDHARRRALEYDNVGVVQGDATRTPITEADAVLATFVCGMFDDPGAVVDDWCDLVGPGGTVTLMNASVTDDLLGRPLNPFFRAFTAAGAPGATVGDVLRAPVGGFEDALARRVADARNTLTHRTENRTYEEFALGFVGLSSGRVR